MRRVLLVLSFFSIVGVAASLRAGEVVLKDGSVLSTSRPYSVKGNQAILTLTDGTLVSIPVASIDTQKTAEANAPKVVKPAAPAGPTAPQTPAEAARAKGTRKASIVLTDEDISHPIAAQGGEKKAGGGDAKVEIQGTTVTRTPTGVTVAGTVANTGNINVSQVSVTVEATNDKNQTVASSIALVAKTSLAPGESSGFSVDIGDPAIVAARPYARYQMEAPKKGEGETAEGQNPASEEVPATAPTPKPEAPAAAPAAPAAPATAAKKDEAPKYVPRGDVAPPAANPQVGTAKDANSPYALQPADVPATIPK
jgi:2-oxoglutarate dehydrogenase E2 component (dihydrolipoamide succinyltransferase)